MAKRDNRWCLICKRGIVMLLIREDFIIKNKRRHFWTKCDIRGSDRGYKTPNHSNQPCQSCSNKKANLTSQITRRLRQKSKCTLIECKEVRHVKGLCEKLYVRKTQGNRGIKGCIVCRKDFECKSLKASYCIPKCKVSVYNSKHREKALRRMSDWIYHKEPLSKFDLTISEQFKKHAVILTYNLYGLNVI
jgi:hypothetical protein